MKRSKICNGPGICMAGGRECKSRYARKIDFKKNLTAVVDRIVDSCKVRDCLNHLDSGAVPSRDGIVEVIGLLREIVYPGYGAEEELEEAGLPYHVGSLVMRCFDLLSVQVEKAFRHECLRNGLPCSNCQDQSIETTAAFMGRLPELRTVMKDDLQAAFDGDPAAKSLDEIVICYPGVHAVTVYRIAHELHELKVPLLPRIMTEYAHSVTGVDIHPGAAIGRRFFIDHGTGVVIGETCVIGDNVKVYQGVTLGAKSFPKDASGNLVRDSKRHPTIEAGVTIYSNAIILGGDVVIGRNATIGGNVWLTESVPPDTVVMAETPKLTFKKKAADRTK